MPAASPGTYQALGLHLESRLVLPELIQAAPSVEREAMVPGIGCLVRGI